MRALLAFKSIRDQKIVMEKVKYLLVAAGLFICGVMVYLMMSGVHLKERRMVKWSSVESPAKAGHKIAMFMFPILNEFSSVRIEESQPFTKTFHEAYLQRALADKVKAEISTGALEDQVQGFIIKVINLKTAKLKEQCRKAIRSHCIGIKALKKFHKKERDSSKLWVSMYRLTKNESVLFYIPEE